MVDDQTLTPVFVVVFFAVLIVFMLYAGGDPWVKQHGRPNVRARRALAVKLDRWPKEQVDGVVRWHDFAALTRRDVVELLHERGWFYSGQDMDADGWPLYATRDPRFAESIDLPPPREDLLRRELGAAAAAGEREHVLDLVPYWSLPRGRVAEVAGRLGWQVRPARSLGCTPRLHLVRLGRRGDGE